MVVSFILAKRRNYPNEQAYTAKESLHVLIEGILPMLTIVIVLGGIILGIVTPTEAAVIAVVHAFRLAFFVYREL